MTQCTSCGKVFIGNSCPFCAPPLSQEHSLDTLDWSTDPTIDIKETIITLRDKNNGEFSVGKHDDVDILQQMDAKLGNIQIEQKVMQNEMIALRKTLLNHFDVSEQVMISEVVKRLDQNQMAIVQNILDVIETHRVPKIELQEISDPIQQVLSKIGQKKAGYYDSKIVSEADNLLDVIDDPKLDINHKLKILIPIIPLILSYEGEIDLKSELNLKTAWQRLRDILT